MGAPLERLAIDIIPQTKKKDSYMYLMVVGDYLTKWIVVIPIKNQ